MISRRKRQAAHVPFVRRPYLEGLEDRTVPVAGISPDSSLAPVLDLAAVQALVASLPEQEEPRITGPGGSRMLAIVTDAPYVEGGIGVPGVTPPHPSPVHPSGLYTLVAYHYP